MADLARLYNFVDATPAVADQVDAELNQIIARINDLPPEAFQAKAVTAPAIGVLPVAKVLAGGSGNAHSATGAFQKVPLNETVLDVGHGGSAHFDNGNDRLICRVAGIYHVDAAVGFDADSTGRRALTVRVNGAVANPATTRYWLPRVELPALVGVESVLSLSGLVSLAVNDYLEMWAYQSSGTLLPYPNAGYAQLGMQFVCPAS